MKKIHIILLAMFGLAFTACQTNEIKLPYDTIDASQYSEVRILNVIPVTGNSDSLYFNGANYSSVSTAVGGYYPGVTSTLAPKYFAALLGNDSISLHFVAKTTAPAVAAFKYKGSMTLTKGKWSAYIYNAAKDPILLQDSDMVPSTDAWKDTVCFVRVANFFFKADGVNSYGKMTLKMKKNITGAAWETVASNIDFGTQSPYYRYTLKNTANVKPWAGTESTITFAIFDSNGVQYQQFTSATTTAKGAYSLTGNSLAKGRAYVIYITGKEGTKNNTDQFINLKQYLPL